MNQGTPVRVLRTGDSHIDRFAGAAGRIVTTREVDDHGYRYTQVCVGFDDGGSVWVNEDEVAES